MFQCTVNHSIHHTRKSEMRRLLLILTALSSAASISLKWTESMDVCKTNKEGPASVADEVKPRDRTWLGRAIYQFDWGNVSLRIEMVDKNRTCYDCNDASSRRNCEFCVLDYKWGISLYTLEQAIGYLIPDRLYIVANFTDIQELPEPDFCLSKEDSASAYGSCTQLFDDGCVHQASNFKIIIQAIAKIEKTTSESAACRGHLLLNVIAALLCMSLLRVEEGYQ
uniref:Uncharacterized protein LOC111134493 isoform X1 n=1 Tax=Crassostrea virginica TaxID=6565 RepID=A0A8B8EF56_CRAVI|nr:uncharacterized protein LOC111134493 isoform X1 [Crassostrea virginica]